MELGNDFGSHVSSVNGMKTAGVRERRCDSFLEVSTGSEDASQDWFIRELEKEEVTVNERDDWIYCLQS